MAGKNHRIEVRADPYSDALIGQAARATGTSVSAFVLDAATTAADRVLDSNGKSAAVAVDFEALIATLHIPDEAPNLARAADRRRRFNRPARP
jgi:uncharacterized protein (DUF1778 family)